MNEIEYAGLLRKSAMETARRMRKGGPGGEVRIWGSLKADILEELTGRPKSAAEIASHLGKDTSSVSSTLLRLEQEGLAVRSGTAIGGNGKAVTAWAGGAAS
ncbi:MarR family protein [Defluviimonas denitrificans]|jgi:predicted Rossmann fold nucleotide-binding protein DprA/Smf involved in DNA uptake|uniref:MarR family protein n=1 Tax=Albidovulum denitrificans TaxID=404881 RepID=A0A2S8S6I3_9RHOB|nr:winged helix-turn-helix domain-containing protein [Defluviimonas denitrificans]PQV56383.1 MarR family protein [Defluviimonas denitrificans]